MTSVRKLGCLIALTSLVGPLSSFAVAQTIVWTDANARKIQRKEVTGGAVSTIVQFPSPTSPYMIHYDPIEKRFYYLFDNGSDLLFQRCNLDGTNPEDISTPSWGNFAINVESRKLYWCNPGGIHRSELDGTGVESHNYALCCVNSVEPHGDTLFFTAGGGLPKGFWRADADGSNEQFLHQSGAPFDLAFDPVENKFYLGALQDIFRMDPDGSDFQMVVDQHQSGDVEHVEVDPRGRKLYWVDVGAKVIRRSNLDGTNIENFVTAADVGNPDFYIQGLTIVDSPTIPVVSSWGVLVVGVSLLVIGSLVIKKRNVAGFRQCGI